jgi:D-glycero-D-manno-heptose 1,7-bisphosphate phosphatase
MTPPKLAILDRDGVINQDSDAYIKTPDEWLALPGSLDAIARLNRAGWRVVVATNQSGVRRRLFSVEVLNRIHDRMLRQLAEVGGRVDAIFICPCHPRDGCRCRKPAPGLLLAIADRLHLALDGVPYIGDKLIDVEAARAAGASPWLVRTGHGEETLAASGASLEDVTVVDDLSAAVDRLLANG